jgi:hypothetical protein
MELARLPAFLDAKTVVLVHALFSEQGESANRLEGTAEKGQLTAW